MKTTTLLLALLAFTHSLRADLEPLTNGQAYLAATLAALSTPQMKAAPIQVNAAIRKATGLQEDAGAKAIVAIPDEGADGMDIANLATVNLPLCRLWMKGSALKLPPKTTANIEHKKVDAEGEKHSVTIWLLGVRQSAKGKPELIVCANQKDPALVMPLKALATPQAADPDAPVQISVETEGEASQLVLTLRGTHQVKLALE
jgi:hypothetical protein